MSLTKTEQGILGKLVNGEYLYLFGRGAWGYSESYGRVSFRLIRDLTARGYLCVTTDGTYVATKHAKKALATSVVGKTHTSKMMETER